MSKHLKYDYIEAAIACNETRHAQIVMKELGISYHHCTPQSMADQFWFWNCENVPENLPKYLSILDINPIEMIGFGLSHKDVESIVNN